MPSTGAPSTAAEPPASPFSEADDTAAAAGALRVETEPRKKATWGELAAMESSARVANNSTANLSIRRNPKDLAYSAAKAQNDAKSGLIERLNSGTSKASEALMPSLCQFDSRRQRVVDFRLPDLDGKPLRFQELDADFVLIEFWGTWSEPSKKTIPHLVELQEQYGKKTLQIVGVADVRSPNFEQESKTVREAAEKLGINYQILLSEADGKSCPLQQALHVQAYPTMILLDRTGQILWRDTGSQSVTLSRLDKVIAARADTGIVRR